MKGNYKNNKKWLESLNLINKYLNENNITNLNLMVSKLHIGTRVTTFLKRKNILYKNESGFYKWNDKIPISVKIIDSYRKWQLVQNNKYKDERNKIVVKSEKVIKVKPKLIHESHKKTNTQEIGLIRKFLKWIY